MNLVKKYSCLFVYLVLGFLGTLSEYIIQPEILRFVPFSVFLVITYFISTRRFGISLLLLFPSGIYLMNLPSFAINYYIIVIIIAYEALALRRIFIYGILVLIFILILSFELYYKRALVSPYDVLLTPILFLVLPGVIGYLVNISKTKEMQVLFGQICNADRTVTNACYNILTPLQSALAAYTAGSSQESHLLRNSVATVIKDIAILYQQHRPSELVGSNVTALRDLGYVVRIRDDVYNEEQIPAAVRKLWDMSEARIAKLVLSNIQFTGPIELAKSFSDGNYIMNITWHAESLDCLTEQDYDYLVVLANRLNGTTVIAHNHGIACFQVKVPIPS